MERNRNSKNKKRIRKNKPRNKRVKLFRILRLLLVIVVLVVVGLFLFSKKISSSTGKRYSNQNKYLTTLESYNSHLEIKDKQVRNSLYDSLNVHINNKIKEYIESNELDSQNISLTIVNKSNGDRINYNSDKLNNYQGINKYFLLIVYNDLIERNLITENQLFEVKEYDISESSVLITENSVGQEINVSELLRMAYKQNDQSAKNILNRILVEELNTSLENEIRKFISYNDQEYSTEQVIEIANKISANPNMYWEVLNKEDNLFIDYIDYSNAMTIRNENESEYYEIGFIISNIEYSYVLHTTNIEPQKISEIGDLLDREIKNYYIQRKY